MTVDVAANGKEGQKTRVSRSVCVIGAGAAGLVALKELREEGHQVTAFEQNEDIGGVWKYDPDTDDDPLGIREDRKKVHSSMYASLRTNLPREIMSFAAYPFVPSGEPGRDDRRFCSHQEVQAYLRDYARHFDLHRHIRFGTQVLRVSRLPEKTNQYGSVQQPLWEVVTRTASSSENWACDTTEFDAVVVCNGHYSQPKLATIEGIASWPGRQLHSHNYRTPGPFAGQTVVLIGAFASGEDISRELAEHCSEVYLSARSWKDEPRQTPPNLHRKLVVTRAYPDGSLEFADGSRVVADVIIHCTGYVYEFSFLESGLVSTEDQRVHPVYEQVFHVGTAPTLSFIGLPFKVSPLPMFELTTRWVAQCLSGRAVLPSEAAMHKWIDGFYEGLKAGGVPVRYTHEMSRTGFDYLARLCEWTGTPMFESWREDLFKDFSYRRHNYPANYRDEWPEDLELKRKVIWEDLRKEAEKLSLGGSEKSFGS
ncbi:Flavin-binding monooxygenase family protein [Klebsormidium nitens]|uniref:Flavin-containing monooxygenase n=1 Tax=Klebsormidium nitens TaxID=105231 RepID=A0A1Y1HVH2_KLENI|nr:Flavin-binding monooxygenase family protein [Klebsormidium nitens]|eukprot:GAQ82615.1 Flavin-binding monooxygenase family protein [Klebsormidium nitens]